MSNSMHQGKLSAFAVAITGMGLVMNYPVHAQEFPPQAQEQPLHLDEMLVQEAIQRGWAEIEMARLAEERAEADAVHSFAELMLEHHGKLNERLVQAAREVGAEIPSGPNESEATVIERLKTLRGAAFDEVYAVGVAQDHMRHHNLYARLAGYASAPVADRRGSGAGAGGAPGHGTGAAGRGQADRPGSARGGARPGRRAERGDPATAAGPLFGRGRGDRALTAGTRPARRSYRSASASQWPSVPLPASTSLQPGGTPSMLGSWCAMPLWQSMQVRSPVNR